MKNDSYIKDKELANLSKEIGRKELRILMDLIKDHICTINCKDGSHGNGFFCNIQFGLDNFLSVLLTNNHVLNIEDIQPGQNINFTSDDIEYNIFIDNNRKTYTNESFDITIIEIKKDDKIDEKSFFDLDKQIFEEDYYKIFINCKIYLINYPKGNEAEISLGLIKSITEDEEKKIIHYLHETNGVSSGSPIINKNNFKVIGIQNGTSENPNFNLGILLKEPIEKFNEEIKMKKNNIYKNIYLDNKFNIKSNNNKDK